MRRTTAVDGARKMWKHLGRLGHPVAHCTVERLMRAGGLRGVVRGGVKRTTIPAKDGCRAGDLVDRAFAATAPKELWVADFTYVRTWSGFCYVAFIIDVFSRMIVGPKADTSMRADLVTDALEMAVWARERAGIADLSGVVHHTDADDVELTTLEWVDWFNNRRLHTELGDVPPAEREAESCRPQRVATMAGTREPSLH